MSNSSKEEELAIAKEQYDKELELVSECCGAGTTGDYLICEDCKEHITGEPEISFEDWLKENE